MTNKSFASTDLVKRSGDTTAISWVIAIARSLGPDWRAATWNPIAGCAPVGDGCRNCWAAAEANLRQNNPRVRHFYEGLTKRTADGCAVFNGTARLVFGEMEKPLRTEKPAVFFVCSRSDLFGEAVDVEWIDRVFAVMALCPQHIFLVLTKRPKQMAGYLLTARPYPNVWLGTSVWDQNSADKFVPHLLATPAGVRFVSVEPMLGPIEFRSLYVDPDLYLSALTGKYRSNMLLDPPFQNSRDLPVALPEPVPPLNWCIVGGESGRNARPMELSWVCNLNNQCASASVPFFFKQWDRKSGCNIYGREYLEVPVMEC